MSRPAALAFSFHLKCSNSSRRYRKVATNYRFQQCRAPKMGSSGIKSYLHLSTQTSAVGYYRTGRNSAVTPARAMNRGIRAVHATGLRSPGFEIRVLGRTTRTVAPDCCKQLEQHQLPGKANCYHFYLLKFNVLPSLKPLKGPLLRAKKNDYPYHNFYVPHVVQLLATNNAMGEDRPTRTLQKVPHPSRAA